MANMNQTKSGRIETVFDPDDIEEEEGGGAI